jgi:hypothetical protein
VDFQRQNDGCTRIKLSAAEDIYDVCFSIGNLKKTSRISGSLSPWLDNRPGNVYFKIAGLKKDEEILIEIEL